MAKLSEQQRAFTKAFNKLLTWAHARGYEFTFGDAFAKTGHIHGSYHYKRLAIDLNLFIDGKYQTTTLAHRPIGEKWEKLGGTWGGRFRKKDGNHYSWGETRTVKV
jgi:hypothetical protein